MDNETNMTQPGKSGMNPLVMVAIVAVIGIVGYIMFANRPTAPTIDTIAPQPETMLQDSLQPTETENTLMENIVTVDMEAGSFFYSPKEIRAKAGQMVRINFIARDMMHDFNIDELNVDGPVVKSGESTVVEFIASKAGTYEYYCSVAQHRANGQVGTLIVE